MSPPLAASPAASWCILPPASCCFLPAGFRLRLCLAIRREAADKSKALTEGEVRKRSLDHRREAALDHRREAALDHRREAALDHRREAAPDHRREAAPKPRRSGAKRCRSKESLSRAGAGGA
jgi:hypothetical protein